MPFSFINFYFFSEIQDGQLIGIYPTIACISCMGGASQCFWVFILATEGNKNILCQMDSPTVSSPTLTRQEASWGEPSLDLSRAIKP